MENYFLLRFHFRFFPFFSFLQTGRERSIGVPGKEADLVLADNFAGYIRGVNFMMDDPTDDYTINRGDFFFFLFVKLSVLSLRGMLDFSGTNVFVLLEF